MRSRGEPFRERNRKPLTPIVVVVLLIGLVGTAIVYGSATGSVPKVIFPLLAALIIGSGVLMVIAGVSRSKRRRAALESRLTESGFRHKSKPGKDERDGLFEPFDGVKALSTGAKGLRFWAESEIDGHTVTVVEHVYLVHTGSTTSTVAHVGAAIPCPEWWPDLSLTPEHLLHKLADAVGKRDLQLEREAFNKRWRVRTDDEDHTLLLLGPAMQEWLELAPKHESWIIGSGWVRCLRRSSVLRQDPIELATRVADFLGRVPPETLAK